LFEKNRKDKEKLQNKRDGGRGNIKYNPVVGKKTESWLHLLDVHSVRQFVSSDMVLEKPACPTAYRLS